MPVEVAVVELVGVAQKTVVAGCNALLDPGRLFLACGRVEMQQIERRPCEPGKRGGLLDQPLPDADAAFGRLPQYDPSLAPGADQLDLDFLLLDLVVELDRAAQRIG